MIVPYGHVLLLAGILFVLGLVCAVARGESRHGAPWRGDHAERSRDRLCRGGPPLAAVGGQVFVLFIMTIAAAEVSVGLALIVRAYRRTGSIDQNTYDLLKW